MTKIRLAVGAYNGDLEKRLEYVSQGSVYDVFPDPFIREYTKHNNFIDFCHSIGCDVTSQDDLNKLEEGIFDDSIKNQSTFESWEDMTETAYQLQIKKN